MTQQRKLISLLLLSLVLIIGSALPRPAAASTTPLKPTSLKVDPAANWQFGAPKLYRELESFFLDHGTCPPILFDWFIFDTSTGQKLSVEALKQQYPQFAELPYGSCVIKASRAELADALHIQIPPDAGHILVFLDYIGPEFMAKLAKPESIRRNQAKLDSLSQFNSIPKFFIQTPAEGIDVPKQP